MLTELTNKDKPKTYQGESKSGGASNGTKPSAKTRAPKDGELHKKTLVMNHTNGAVHANVGTRAPKRI